MSANNTFLAIFLGSKTNPSMSAWNALPETEQKEKMKEGVAAWGAWAEKHKDEIIALGGPLGKTKVINSSGIADATNALTGYCVVRAASHEAAAEMFVKHPHFMIFPGESVEVMPVLPVPNA